MNGKYMQMFHQEYSIHLKFSVHQLDLAKIFDKNLGLERITFDNFFKLGTENSYSVDFDIESEENQLCHAKHLTNSFLIVVFFNNDVGHPSKV
ncbi:hypothetical protein DERP_007662 [Dermatophagoides pteronyssinus]|uniref:Uncharacterized protein n=1 Tax=Dermatophagoides pteronyssinus TaxID=6956 RepID=A0ABQ8JKZ4_DERPT|nr:hypothetical protein DERP_007662 [Dermatophagoides pteronyssinus]